MPNNGAHLRTRDICRLNQSISLLNLFGVHVVWVDEMSGIQALERIHPQPNQGVVDEPTRNETNHKQSQFESMVRLVVGYYHLEALSIQ